MKCFLQICFCVLLAALAAAAATLSVVPATQTVGLGASTAVTLAFDDGYVGDFDVIVDWDGSIINFVSASFGTQLGGPANSLQGSLTPVGASLETFEVSLLSVADLITLQPGQMATLLTLNFTGIALGVSPIEISVNALGDENGFPHTTLTIEDGEIRVTDVIIPEPRSLLLAASALSLLVLRRVRQ